MVHKVLMKQKINHQRYEIVCARVMQGGSPTEFDDAIARLPRRRRQGTNLVSSHSVLLICVYSLKQISLLATISGEFHRSFLMKLNIFYLVNCHFYRTSKMLFQFT